VSRAPRLCFINSQATQKSTFEELSTTLEKIRSLSKLTPGHFLFGGLLSIVEPKVKGEPLATLKGSPSAIPRSVKG